MEPDERLGTRLILENNQIRVWEHRVAKGSTGRAHTHRRPYLSVVVRGTTGDTIGPNGELLEKFELQPGNVFWYGPDHLPETHALRNTGEEDVVIVTIELLR